MKLSDLKPGATVVLDGGFPCIKAGPVDVQHDDGGFYFLCLSGKHYFDGQEGNDGELIGVARPTVN
jgi:hypothetical protein